MDTMGEEMDGEDLVVGSDLVVGGFDVVGNDVEGSNPHMRALNRRFGGVRTMSQPVKVAMPRVMRNVSGQGVSTPSEELDSLPFTLVTPTPLVGVLPAGVAFYAEAHPQRPFRGERLILAAFKTNSMTGAVTDMSYLVVISPAWYVGAVQVGASQGETPLGTFNSTAFGVRLSIPPAGQGTRIYLPMQTKAPLAANESLIVTATIIGRAVR